MRSLHSDPTLGYDVSKVEHQTGDGPCHTDSAAPGSFENTPIDMVPLSLLWAVETNTRLRLRPNGGDWMIITMEPCDVLVFRGDVCHNGLGYAQFNIRIHAYIDVPSFKRKAGFLVGGC